jgi:hypothetical protein
MAFEQPELALEWPVYKHYTVELRKGVMPNLDTVRSTKATDVDGAISLIEGFRDLAASRNSVTWQEEEVNPEGFVFGLAPGGEVWQIMCVPPLGQELG